MYAMDTAVHYEHRNETRRTRWDLRRSARQAPTTPVVDASTAAATTDNPVHDFID